MLLSKCAVCDSKKSKFMKQQENKSFFSRFYFVLTVLIKLMVKMSEIVNKFLLVLQILVNSGNTPQKVLNEIRKIIYSLYREI